MRQKDPGHVFRDVAQLVSDDVRDVLNRRLSLLNDPINQAAIVEGVAATLIVSLCETLAQNSSKSRKTVVDDLLEYFCKGVRRALEDENFAQFEKTVISTKGDAK